MAAAPRAIPGPGKKYIGQKLFESFLATVPLARVSGLVVNEWGYSPGNLAPIELVAAVAPDCRACGPCFWLAATGGPTRSPWPTRRRCCWRIPSSKRSAYEVGKVSP